MPEVNPPQPPSVLDHSNTYLFMGEVKTKTIYPLIDWVLSKNIEIAAMKPTKRPDHLRLIISSYGGDVADCFAAVDVLRGSPVPIHTHGIGGIASCGLTLFLCGSKRTLGPHAFLTSHQYSGGIDGKHHEQLAERAAQDWTHQSLIALYAAQTGSDLVWAEYAFFGPSDKHFSPLEAVRVGLAHQISHNFY